MDRVCDLLNHVVQEINVVSFLLRVPGLEWGVMFGDKALG